MSARNGMPDRHEATLLALLIGAALTLGVCILAVAL